MIAGSSMTKFQLSDDSSNSKHLTPLTLFFSFVNPTLQHFPSRWRPLPDLKQWANTGVINRVNLDFLWFVVGGSIHAAAHWLFLASDATEAQLALLPARVCAACSLCLYSQNVRREWKARDVCARFLEAKLLHNCPHSSQRPCRLWIPFLGPRLIHLNILQNV